VPTRENALENVNAVGLERRDARDVAHAMWGWEAKGALPPLRIANPLATRAPYGTSDRNSVARA
jgi:hypothetical protein